MAIRFPLFPLHALLFGASLLLPAAASAQDAAFLAARDAFALAGLSPLVTITGSLVLALALGWFGRRKVSELRQA
mgnify:CR=1 FL=1